MHKLMSDDDEAQKVPKQPPRPSIKFDPLGLFRRDEKNEVSADVIDAAVGSNPLLLGAGLLLRSIWRKLRKG